MPFQSSNSDVAGVQLKVQQLCVKLADVSVVSTSASTATIDVKQTLGEVRSAIFFDDSAGTAAPVVASNQVISGTTVRLTLSAALAAADSITLQYVITD